MMSNCIQLATFVLDLDSVSWFDEQEDSIRIIFGPDDDPPERLVTDADADLLRQWLEEDRRAAEALRQSRGEPPEQVFENQAAQEAYLAWKADPSQPLSISVTSIGPNKDLIKILGPDDPLPF
jgi:hypothetical protein